MPHLLTSLFTRTCSHQFAWPRRSADGSFYQVCLVCGDCFRYDWNTMRREERIGVPTEALASARSVWKPRSRRLRWQKPILYRESSKTDWNSGNVQNISESGVFVGEQPLGAAIEVEMIFVMPQEITGQPNSKVLCRGDVVRSVAASSGKHAIAVIMSGYSFLPDD